MSTRTLSAAKTMTRPDVGTSFNAGEPGTSWNEKSSDDQMSFAPPKWRFRRSRTRPRPALNALRSATSSPVLPSPTSSIYEMSLRSRPVLCDLIHRGEVLAKLVKPKSRCAILRM